MIEGKRWREYITRFARWSNAFMEGLRRDGMLENIDSPTELK
ncbi:MAG TPA: hypothetical protein VF553_15255 [Pyrinomonadaceae bacterium]